MKSLQESLFDKDLVEKDIPIDFETLRDMLFNFGRRNTRLFRNGVIYHEGRQSIYLKKFLDDSYIDETVCFELELGVTNTYQNGAAFNTPRLCVHDRWAGIMGRNAWKSSGTDVNATKRTINKKIDPENDDRSMATISGTNDNISKVFKLYEGMMKVFCSIEFEKKLKEYISRFEGKKEIPGLIMDILMKELINKA